MVAEPSPTAIAPDLLQAIQSKLQTLPPDQQQQVLDFVEFLAQKSGSKDSEKSLWDVLDEAAANIPADERAKIPSDGSYQHDHYLYGTPKREL